MKSVREVTFALLRELGINHVFGNPGSTELTMFRDFPADFRYVLGLQESVVVGMADGYAQATHNAAFVNLHSAVGVGHAMGNLFTAYRNRTPLVITAGQQSRSLLQMEPFLFSTQPTELPKPYVKWSCEPARPQDVPAAIARAYYLAMQPPCGPTFVSVPIDDWDETTEPLAVRKVSRSIRADAAAIAAVAAALNASSRPVFIIGGAVDRDGAWDDLVRLAERHGALVWSSPLIGRAGFPEDHPLVRRISAGVSRGDLWPAAGTRCAGRAGRTGIHVSRGRPRRVCSARTQRLPDHGGSRLGGQRACRPVDTRERGFFHCRLAGRTAIAPGCCAKGKGATAAPAGDRSCSPMPTLRRRWRICAQPDSILVEEAPSTRGPMQTYLPILRSETFYTCASGGLGHGLPAAVGIALGKPDRKVVAILGDGSAMYSIQGLWSAAQLKLPITFIIVNNARYEALHHFSKRFGLSHPVGTDLPGIDFVQLAKSQGCDGLRVTGAAELEPALRKALAAPGPFLLEVVVA